MSEVGNALSPHCDLAMIWYHDHEDKKIKVSLRAFHDNIDASEIAKQYGGGGHKSAAGFTWTKGIEDLFDKPKPKRRRSTKKADSTKAKDDSFDDLRSCLMCSRAFSVTFTRSFNLGP